MTDLFKDASFLGAVVGAISGLIGTAIGGFVTYRASLRQYRTEHQTKQNAALAAAFIEVCRNQDSLILELDRVLPLWLTKRYGASEVAKNLAEATTPIPTYDTRVYDSFFSELISSTYGSELKTYYDRLSYLNQISKVHWNGLPSKEFANYVRTLVLAVEVAYEIASELNNCVLTTMPKNWGKENNFKTLIAQRERALYMAALYRTELSVLESFIAGEKSTSPLPTLISSRDKSALDPWVIPARKILKP